MGKMGRMGSRERGKVENGEKGGKMGKL